MRLIDIVEIQNRLEEIAKEEKIEGVKERLRQAVDNYSVAYGKYWDDPNNFEFKIDALEYGIEQATIYIQQKFIEQEVAEENDDWHKSRDAWLSVQRRQYDKIKR